MKVESPISPSYTVMVGGLHILRDGVHPVSLEKGII